jgi:serine/threonine-protein kinase
MTMRSALNTCDPDRLRRLAQDGLTPEETIWLERHVDGCTRCREALDQLVGEDRWLGDLRRYLGPSERNGDEPDSDDADSLGFLAPSDWPGSIGRLGTYEVLGVLGRGGMGVVLKAFDPALGRNVAIKVLSVALASCGAARRRFLREARAAAAVVHEHVVSVFAVEEREGLPFLVMEYVPGRSLAERLEKQGPLSLPEILRIGMQTASGLAAAHDQGLVHRDVKPANILLENGVERVRLSDFGLARAAADAGVTQSGVIAGTPHYMAPEQARGETTDHRADLFGLGSTLYAMCTGHPPFRAESPLAVLRRVSDEEPRALREINPDVPAWLESIVAKLHAKDPARRYATASEVASLLGRCLAHVQQPLAAPLPPELLEQMKQPGARRFGRRRWAAALLGLVAAGGGALAVAPWRAREITNPRWGIVRQLFPAQPSSSPAPQSRNAPDDIAQAIDALRERLRAEEAELYRPIEWNSPDKILGRTADLGNQIRDLERDVASSAEPGRGKPGNLFQPQP